MGNILGTVGKGLLKVVLIPFQYHEEMRELKLQEHGKCPLYPTQCEGFEPNIFSGGLNCQSYRGVLNSTCEEYKEKIGAKKWN